MNLKVIKLFVLCFLFVSTAWSQGRPVQGGVSDRAVTPSSTPQANMTVNAQNSKKKTDHGKMITQVAGVAYIGLGTWLIKTAVANPPQVVMGVFTISQGLLALVQSANMGGASNLSNNAVNQTKDWGDGNFDLPGNGDPTAGMNPKDLETLRTSLKDLKKKGYEVNLKKATITDPKGKVISAKQGGSSAFAKANGVTDQMLESNMKKLNAIAKEAEQTAMSRVLAIPEDGSSGGGAGGGGIATSTDEFDFQMPGDGSMNMPPIERDPAALSAGLSKNFNGEPIGVSNDSIFMMMNRRYGLKDQQGFFFKPMEGFTAK